MFSRIFTKLLNKKKNTDDTIDKMFKSHQEEGELRKRVKVNGKVLRAIKKEDLEGKDYLKWNAFIDLIAMESYNELTEVQKVAHLVFLYDSEIQNGGHLQYFENKGTDLANETIGALEVLGARCQALELEKALKIRISKERKGVETKEEYVSEALKGEYDENDSNYHECKPTINQCLEEYLKINLNEFIFIE